MAIADKDCEFMEEVAAYFRSTIDTESMPEGSIRDTALHFNLTRTKVQKILVTMGEYSSPQVQEIQDLRNQGMSIKDIAEKLEVSRATVSASLPYSSSFHGTAEPSEHTQAVRDYRAYEKAQAERMKGKEEEMAKVATEDNALSKTGISKNAVRKTGVCKNGKKGNKIMENKLSRKKGEYTLPSGLIRLHVALGWVDNDEEVQILQEYGGVKRGKTITRDIIVPRNMPLRSLHFTLQRAFGFQDSHLHRFEIYGDDLLGVTGDKMENLLNLRGVIFTQERVDGQDPFEPRYLGGSFKKWLKAQYTGPYDYYGDWLSEFHKIDGVDENDWDDELLSDDSPDDEYYLLKKLHSEAEEDEKNEEDDGWKRLELVPAYMIDELEGSGNYVKWVKDPENSWNGSFIRCTAKESDAWRYEKCRLGDLDIRNGLKAIHGFPIKLVERLKIGDVLALSGDYLPYDDEGKKIHTVTGLKHPQVITHKQIQEALKKDKEIRVKPFADMLIYIYDYGDNWHFTITGSKGCSDLVEEGVISKGGLEKSVDKVQKEKHPVLVARDGEMLIEDCGNVDGFVSFLKSVNISPEQVIEQENDFGDPDEYDGDWDEMDDDEDRDENGMTRAELLNWAFGQGWHRNDTTDINLL